MNNQEEEDKKMKRTLKEIRQTKYRRALKEDGRTEWTRWSSGEPKPWLRTVKSSLVNRLSLSERGKGGDRRRGKMYYALNMAWPDSRVDRRSSNAALRSWNNRVLREEVLDWWESRKEEEKS